MKKIITSVLCSTLAILLTVSVWPQSGGTFVIETSVTAGDGQTAAVHSRSTESLPTDAFSNVVFSHILYMQFVPDQSFALNGDRSGFFC